ncbi:MAG: MBL fold metallo-hydrolase [Deltaproteobacteria bacterium]|nr:MBL fold metallo-hydrolase [Deltaproteobacteria bacterium]
MSFRLRWLGTACFEILLPNGRTIVIDPYLDDAVGAPITSDQFEHCDGIFITHGHYDHVLDVGKLAARFRPRIFCNEQTRESLIRHQGVDPSLIHPVKPGDRIREEGLTVEVVRGVHVNFESEYKRITGQDLFDGGSDMDALVKRATKAMLGTDVLPERFREWMDLYPQGEQLNFVFDPAGGRRIYMAGSYPDPGLIEVAEKTKAYITLLQVLPGEGLKGLEEQTARFAIASGCKIAVPQHHDPLIEGATLPDLTQLKESLARESTVLFQEFVPGQWYLYE